MAATTTRELARSLGTPALPRHDPLAQFNAPAGGPALDVRGGVRTFWAFGLAAAGVGTAMWLVILIHAAVFEPQTVGLLDRLRPGNPEDLALTLPAGKVQLPPALTTVIAYVFLVLLVSIAARIAAMMVKQGVSLLRQDALPEKPEKSEPGSPLPPLASGQ